VKEKENDQSLIQGSRKKSFEATIMGMENKVLIQCSEEMQSWVGSSLNVSIKGGCG
jgi:hypothetical protein